MSDCNCGRWSCRTCKGQKISSFASDNAPTDADLVTGLSGSGNASQNVNFDLASLQTYFNLAAAGFKRATFDANANTEDLIPILAPANTFSCTDTTAARTLNISTSTIAQGTATTPVYIFVKDESGGAATNNITIVTEGAETIDGASSLTITADYGSVQMYSNGINLFTVAP